MFFIAFTSFLTPSRYGYPAGQWTWGERGSIWNLQTRVRFVADHKVGARERLASIIARVGKSAEAVRRELETHGGEDRGWDPEPKSRNLLIAFAPEWTSMLLVGIGWHQLSQWALPTKRSVASMRGTHRLPDFSVVVWIKKNEDFPTLRSEVLAAAGVEPYEMTEYQGMADFHWGMTSIVDARKLAEALKVVSQRPEVVLLRIMSLVDDVASFSIKDERVTKH
jgi:hypothetical protein